MKKNLRIVSAAAAALLAVAPVAASAVSTVNADVTNLGPASTAPSTQTNQVQVTVTLQDKNGKDIKMGDPVTSATKAKVEAKQGDKTLSTSWTDDSSVSVTLADGSSTTNAVFGTKTNYVVNIKGLRLDGLTTSQTGKYVATGNGNFANSLATGTTGKTEVTAAQLSQGVNYTDSFRLFDTTSDATPWFSNAASDVQIPANGTTSDVVSSIKYTVPANGSTPAQNVDKAIDGASTTDILKAAEGAVKLHNEGSAPLTGTNADGYLTTENDIKSQLQSQGITVDKNNNISVSGDKSFTITLTAQNSISGKTATVKVVFKANSAAEYTKHPVIYFYQDGNAVNKVGQIAAGDNPVAIQEGDQKLVNSLPVIAVKVNKNGQFQPTDYFKAAINKDHSSLLNLDQNKKPTVADVWTNDFTVVSNDVDMSTEGLYHVTVSAKNNDGKETRVTIPVAVTSENAKLATIKNTPGYPVTVYNVLADSTVKSANNYDFLYNGHPVKTYETKTIDGKSYTRIQDTAQSELASDNNAWVESDKLSTYVAPTEASVSKTVMYKSALYTADKDGKTATNSGKTYAGYTDHDFVKDDKTGDAKVYTLTVNGVEGNFFKVANENAYVRVRNIKGSGSKMTLKHNAYIYKSNGKRNGKKVLKKGATIEVFGGKCTMKKYKKAVARIGVNQYVKVANIKTWTLAK